MEKNNQVSILYIVSSAFVQNSIWYRDTFRTIHTSREEEEALPNFYSWANLQRLQGLSLYIQPFKEHSPYACWLPDSE